MARMKDTIPSDLLISAYQPVDYYDITKCEADDLKGITTEDIQIALWSSKPAWVDRLFKLRNILVKPFGLKTGEDSSLDQLTDCIRNGKAYGLMSLQAKSEKETVICLTDKHLSAYVSIFLERGEKKAQFVFAYTLVKFHSTLGYVYFYSILPFHKIVVKKMLKYSLNLLIQKNNINI